jgi:hypothetical protein
MAALLSLTACAGDDSSSDAPEPTLITAAPGSDGSTTTPDASGTTAAPSEATVAPSDTTVVAPGPTSAPGTGTEASTPETDGSTAPTATGDITETVPTGAQETLPSVPLDESAPVGEIQIAIAQIERIQAEARLPGEIAGPAFAVHVSITNNSDAPIDLSTITVNLFDATDAVAPTLSADPAAPFAGQLDAGQTVSAVYVFQFPDGTPQPVRVEVSQSAETPVAVFTGTVS